MAHIEVHRIEAIAARRRARLDQVAALTPFPERPPQYEWEFRRGGFVPLLPVAVGGRAGRIYMGEELPPTEAGAPPTVRAPAAERSPPIGALPRGVPEQLCYALTVRGTVVAPDVAGVSTPPLPWPAQIVGASLHWDHAGVFVSGAWGLHATRDEWTNANNTITGEALITYIEDDAFTMAGHASQNRLTPVPLLPPGASNDGNSRDPATQLIGSIIREAGLRLTFVTSMNIDAAADAVLVITLRQLIETRAAPVFHAPAAPRPPAASRTSGARASRPLPQQHTEPQTACNTALMSPLERLQFERNGEAWFRARHRLSVACGGPGPLAAHVYQPPKFSPGSQAAALQAVQFGLPPLSPGELGISPGQFGLQQIRALEAASASARAAGLQAPVSGPLGGR